MTQTQNQNKKRILAVSEFSGLNTGFSVMTKEILSGLKKTGKYEVAELASYVSPDDPRIMETDWPVYACAPSGKDEDYIKAYSANRQAQFGSLKFEEACLDFKPDIVISWRDFWHDEFILHSPYRRLFKYVWSTCIDSEPPQAKWLSDFSTVDVLSSYTNWGLNVIKHYGNLRNVSDIVTMPGVDLNIFKPLPKKEIRNKYNLKDDSNIILSVMRNQPRKLFPDLMREFRFFLDKCYKSNKHKLADNTFLYLHTSYPDMGFDIKSEIIKYNLSHKIILNYHCNSCKEVFPSFWRGETAHCVRCGQLACSLCNTSVGCTREQLCEIYNIADLYVQYSVAGALEMPIIEAKACGIPTIAIDYAAPYELNRLGGSFAEVDIATFRQESCLETSQLRAYPENEQLADHFMRYFKLNDQQKESLSKEARETAIKNHSFEKTVENWDNILSNIQPLNPNRWIQEPQFINTDPNSVPWNAPDLHFVRYLVNMMLPDKHPNKTFLGEKELLKMLSQKFGQDQTGKTVPCNKESIYNIIKNIADNYNHYEYHRFLTLTRNKEQQRKDFSYVIK